MWTETLNEWDCDLVGAHIWICAQREGGMPSVILGEDVATLKRRWAHKGIRIILLNQPACAMRHFAHL